VTEAAAQSLSTAERAAAAALSVPGVAVLHGGEFGTVATYLPGRRVTGVRIDDSGCSVHVTVRYPADLFAVADAVRTAVRAIVDTPVDVTIEDLTADQTGPQQ